LCASSELGIVEVLAALTRRKESFGPGSMAQVLNEVETQFAAFHVVVLDRGIRCACREVLERHALRGVDCVHLASAMPLRRIQQERVVLVACDGELIDAAMGEGFEALNPAENPALPVEG
jgi:hypothetical protein